MNYEPPLSMPHWMLSAAAVFITWCFALPLGLHLTGPLETLSYSSSLRWHGTFEKTTPLTPPQLALADTPLLAAIALVLSVVCALAFALVWATVRQIPAEWHVPTMLSDLLTDILGAGLAVAFVLIICFQLLWIPDQLLPYLLGGTAGALLAMRVVSFARR